MQKKLHLHQTKGLPINVGIVQAKVPTQYVLIFFVPLKYVSLGNQKYITFILLEYLEIKVIYTPKIFLEIFCCEFSL